MNRLHLPGALAFSVLSIAVGCSSPGTTTSTAGTGGGTSSGTGGGTSSGTGGGTSSGTGGGTSSGTGGTGGCSGTPKATAATLVTLPAGNDARTLTLVGDTLYMLGAGSVNDGKSHIYSAKVSGGAVSTVTVTDDYFWWYGPKPVASAAGFFSFDTMLDLLDRPLAGGAPAVAAKVSNAAKVLAADPTGTTISWDDQIGKRIASMPAAGGAVTTFCTLPPQALVDGLFDDGAGSVFVSLNGTTLSRCDSGASTTDVAALSGSAHVIAADDTYAYWLDGGLHRAPRSGGGQVEVLDAAAFAPILATPEGLIWNRGGDLVRLAKGADPACPETLASTGSIHALAVDSAKIYALTTDAILSVPR